MEIEVNWLKAASKTMLGVICACCVAVLTGCEDDSGGSDLDAPSTDLSGTWQALATTDGEADIMYFALQLSQSGNNLSGLAGEDPLSGTISGNVVDLIITDTEGGYTTAASGALDPDNMNQMAGTWTDVTGSGTWRARR